MFYISLIISKLCYYILKILGKNATLTPGTLANKIYPDFIKKVNKPKFIIGVTGTNGKTTCTNLIINYYEKSGHKVLSNKMGTNILNGVTSSFVIGTTIFNKSKYDMAVIEIDERSTPKILPYLPLDYLLCTNLVRDSIRRNANPDFIFNLINSNINPKTKLILNADDLISGNLGENNEKVYFSVGKLSTDKKECINNINDRRICPKCNTMLEYKNIKYFHIGEAHCPNCDFSSPKGDYIVKNVDEGKNVITIKHKKESYEFNLFATGVFNVYNEVAVIALLNDLGESIESIQKFFKKEKIMSSRYEYEIYKGRKIIKQLAKGQNPGACSCVFEYVKNEPNKKELILIIYDYYDARKSSETTMWFYDCDFEFLNDQSIEKIIVAGPRSHDIYYRLLMADIPNEKLIRIDNELDAPNYLTLDKKTDIWLLEDMFTDDITNKVRDKIKVMLDEKEN